MARRHGVQALVGWAGLIAAVFCVVAAADCAPMTTIVANTSVTFNDTVFTTGDHYGPGTCVWTVVFPVSTFHQLTIDARLAAPSNDHLALIDGVNASADPFAVIYGYTTATTYQFTRGRNLTVIFFSDNRPKNVTALTGQGFVITTMPVNASQPVIYCQPKGTNQTVLVNGTGSLTEPRTYFGTAPYLAGDCGWLFTAADPSALLTVTINPGEYFGAPGDSLVVYDGVDTNAPVIDVMSTYNIPGYSYMRMPVNAKGSGQFIYVKFNSRKGDKTGFQGFTIHYQSSVALGGACGKDPVVITTPYYTPPPAGADWPNAQGLLMEPPTFLIDYTSTPRLSVCRWWFKFPPGSLISFIPAMLPGGGDFVTFYDGPNMTAPVLLTIDETNFISHILVDQLYTTGPDLFVDYETGTGAPLNIVDGLLILYNATTPQPPICVNSRVAVVDVGAGGTFSMPNPYAAVPQFCYPLNLACGVVFETTAGQRVRFSIQAYDFAVGDTLEILDVQVAQNVSLAILTGQGGQANFISSGVRLLIRFTSGGAGSPAAPCNLGFSATYQAFVSGGGQCAPLTTLSGSGSLSAPVPYDGVAPYALQNCAWLLTATGGMPYVSLSIATFDFAAGHALLVYDGNSQAAPLIGSVTSYGLNQTIYSNGTQMYVVLNASAPARDAPTGFTAEFGSTATLPPSRPTCTPLQYVTATSGSQINVYTNYADQSLPPPPLQTCVFVVNISYAAMRYYIYNTETFSAGMSVMVYDGDAVAGGYTNRILTWCDPKCHSESYANSAVSSLNTITIVWKTGGVVPQTARGFNAQIYATSQPNFCSGFQDITMTVGSYFYGQPADYQDAGSLPNMECSWKVSSPEKSQYFINGEAYPSSQTVIILYDGPNVSCPILAYMNSSAHPSSVLTPGFYSSGNEVFITLVSSGAQFQGATDFLSLRAEAPVKACNGDYFQYPTYTSNIFYLYYQDNSQRPFPANVVCTVYFRATVPRFTLAFQLQALDTSSMVVYDGGSFDSPVVANVTGRTSTVVVPFTGGDAIMVFTAGPVAATTPGLYGFIAQTVPGGGDFCSGFQEVAAHDGYLVGSSPQGPFYTAVPANSNCTFRVKFAGGLNHFGVLQAYLSPGDVVSMYDDGVLIARLTGHGIAILPSQVYFMPSCSEIFIEFTTDANRNPYEFGWGLQTAQYANPNGPPAVCRRDINRGVCSDLMLTDAGSIAAATECMTVVGSVTLDTAGITALGDVSLPFLRTITGGMMLQNVQLNRVSFPNLTCLGIAFSAIGSQALDIDWSALLILNQGFSTWRGNTPTVSMPLVQNLYALVICDNNYVQTISFPSLYWVNQAVGVKRDPALSKLDLPSLFFLSSSLQIDTTPLLKEVHVATLKYCQTVSISGAGIVSLNLSAIAINFIMLVSVNPSLVAMNAERLRGTTQSITINQNTLLATIDMPSLVGVFGTFLVSGSAVAQLLFPQLGLVYTATFTSNVFLDTLEIPRITEIDGGLTVTSSTIKSLYLPDLLTVQTIVLTDNQNLVDLQFCSLQTASSVTVGQCPGLPCYDLFHMFNHTGATITATSPDCDGTVSGLFGCDYNITTAVDEGCGLDLSCIQAKISTAFSDRYITVYVPPGTYTGCSAGPLDLLGKIITLLGAGPESTVIDCQGSGRALVIDTAEGAGTLISGIGFRNGQAADGGLVYVANAAQPTLRNCAFTNGRAVGSGGALAVVTGASVTLENATFTGCSAAAGGAVAVVSARISLSEIVLLDNTATNQGGAVYLSGAGATTATRVQASGNHAARGGAVFSDGAMTITDATFTDNAATQFGGALALVPTEPVDTWVTMTAVTIDANSAPSGGGVYSFSASLRLTQVTLTSNQAGSGGGGGAFVTCNENYRFLTGITGACGVRVVASTCSVASNTAAGSGGGLYFQEIQASVNGTRFTSNSAGSSGAALYAVTALLSVTATTVDSNSAGESGGGVYCQPLKGTCAVASTSFIQNYAGVAGGAIFLCMSGCPGYNDTTAQNIVIGVVPDVVTGNGFTFNAVGAGGYGKDTASDPNTLSWLTAPDVAAVSGRELSNTLRIEVTDAYSNVITRYTSPLAIILSMLTSTGASALGHVSLSGATTVLASSGVATFPAMSVVAATVEDADIDYLLQARLSLVAGVDITSPVHVLPCAPGQGRLDNTTVGLICSDCPAGTSGSSDTNYYCLSCAAGTFSGTALSPMCTPCPVDTYAPAEGATTCLACPSGYHASALGSAVCTQEAAIISTPPTIASYAIPLGAALAALFIIAILVAFIIYRLARKRTLKAYYLDTDSTVRTNAMKSPLQREVEKMVLATNTTRVGGGVYADIYKAKYQEKWIAMKIIKGEMTQDTLAIKEFQREIICLNRLAERPHPGLLHLFFFIQRKPACIGIEFCSGGTLKSALSGKMLLSDRVRLMTEAASALTVLHALNIAHLDIKTDNMLLDDDNHIKLADFGISKTLGSEAVMLPLEYVNAAGAGEGDLIMNPIFATMGTSMSRANSISISDGGELSRAGTMGGAASMNAAGTSVPNPTFMGSLNSMDLGTGGGVGNDSPRGSDTQRTDMRSKTLASGKWEDKSSQLGSRSDPMASMGGGMGGMASMGMGMFGLPDDDTAFTIQYADPARIVNDQPGDLVFLQQADIYSFAVVMWAVIAQEEPYAGLEPTVVLEQLKANPLQRPVMPADAPKVYAQLVQECWSNERMQRPTFRVVFDRLKAHLREHYDLLVHDPYDNPDDRTYSENRGFMVAETQSMKSSRIGDTNY